MDDIRIAINCIKDVEVCILCISCDIFFLFFMLQEDWGCVVMLPSDILVQYGGVVAYFKATETS